MVLGKELEQLLSGAEESEYVARIMREQAEAQVQEQILPEIQPFLPYLKLRECDVSIKNGEVEVLLDAPGIMWKMITDYSSEGIILDREYSLGLNRRFRNLFDEIGGRYGIKILGFGKRVWESGYEEFPIIFPDKEPTLSEVLGLES